MHANDAASPRPRRRMWRTRLRWPRRVDHLAPPLEFLPAAEPLPELGEAAQWGEVCLLHDEALVLHRDGTYTTSHRQIAMLHGDENLAAWDEASVAYDRRVWRPTLRTARVHLPDGQTLDAVRRRRRFPPSSPGDPTDLISISFPHLRPGAVVEWDFQEDFFRPNEIAAGVWGEFFLQTPIPCRRRRITVAIAHPFTVAIRQHHGAGDPTVFKVGPYDVHQWDLRNTPALEVDAWVPAARDFTPWLDVSTLASWRPIARHYQRELQPEAEPPDEVRRLVRELTQQAETTEDKAFRIHQFLARDVRYGRHPDESALPTSRQMGSMMVDLRGDCKDKSAMLAAMLGEVSISARVAVLLTNDHGFRPYLPSGRFNHAVVVATVDDRQLWIDPAAGPYTFGDTPSSDQGVQALLLGGAVEVAQVPPARPVDHGIDRVAGGSLAADGTYEFETLVTARGDRAAALRDALRFREQEHRRNLMRQSVAADHPGAQVDDLIIEHIDDLRHPPRYKYKVTLPAWGRRIQSLLIVKVPWFEPFEGAGLFAARSRAVPLATPRACSVSEHHTIELPTGFSGYGLPGQHEESSPWATYQCQVSVDDGRLQCQRRVQFHGGIVTPDAFAEFRRFWEACVRWDREDVVLVDASAPVQGGGGL